MADNPVLVTGATGRMGRAVLDQLVGGGVPVRALTRRPHEASLPPDVEVVGGDFTVPESLDTALRGVDAVLLDLDRLTDDSRRRHRASCCPRATCGLPLCAAPTPHPFFQQPNPMAALHAEIERLIGPTLSESTVVRPGMLASNALF